MMGVHALLVDEELADQIWEAWDRGEIGDQVALLAWWLLAIKGQDVETMTHEQIHDELRTYGIDPDLVHLAPKTTQ